MSKTALSTANPGRGLVSGSTPGDAVSMEEAARPIVEDIRANAVTLHRGELAQSLHLAEVTGMIAAFQYNEAANRVAMLKAFAQIKESGVYKGMQVRDRNSGKAVTVNTWEEFCNAHGYSYPKIAEDLKNLATFGGDFLELQDSLGLGYRELRRLRAGIGQLPEGERKKVLAEINSVQGKDEAVEKLEEVRTRLAEAELRVQELSENMRATEEVSRKKSGKLEELEVRLERMQSMSPTDQEKNLADIRAKAREDVEKECQQVFGAVISLCGLCAAVFRDERADKSTVLWVHERVAMLMDNVSDTVLNSGIDVDLRARFELPAPEGEGTVPLFADDAGDISAQ